MSLAQGSRPTLIPGAAVIALAIIVSVLMLRNRDVTLTDDDARESPQAKLAIDFLGALRSMDADTIAKLATAEQITRIQQEVQQPTTEFQEMRTMMLDDLPDDPVALKRLVTSMQRHGDRAVVYFETKANTWFLQFAFVDGAWKVAGF